MKQRKLGSRVWRTDWVDSWVGAFLAGYLLFPGLEGFRGISAAKTWTFYGFMGVLAVLGVLYLVRDLRAGVRRPLTGAQIAALCFLGWTLVSAACSPAGSLAWYSASAHEGALTVCCYVLLFLIISRWGWATEGHFRVLFWSLTVFCLICVLQALGGDPLGLYPEDLNFYDGYGVKYSGAYAGTLGNVDLVSAFLALTVPMLLVHTRGQTPREAWPCWALAAVCLGILFWIRVLCGLVGLVLGGAVCLLVLCPERWRGRILLTLAGLGLAVLAVLWFFDLPVQFFHQLHELLHGRFDDSFGTGRFYIWRQMLERIPDRLWLGVGPDAARFSGLEPFVRHDELGNVVYNAAGKPITATITDAHCYPLHILYCQGLPALVSWLALVGLSLAHWVRARRDRGAAILGAGLACFLCAMLFCFSSVIVMPFFWLGIGLLNRAGEAERRGRGTGDNS